MMNHDLHAVAFPELSEAHITALAGCPLTRCRTARDGEVLFHVGQRDCTFFIVKSGTIEVIDKSGDSPKTVTIHYPGHFTGDVTAVTGEPSLVAGVARGETDVYEISPEALKEILNHHPSIADVILNGFIARRQLLRELGDFTGPRVIGSRYSTDTFRVREFLAKNRVLFTWLDLEADAAVKKLLDTFHLTEADTPVVAWGKQCLRNPSNRDLAETLGVGRPIERKVYDFAVVGAGPAGLAAAVYAASEGLSTVILERVAPGGQAGRSMRIENYLGFPTGITGSELAERATLQANKFGARIAIASPVLSLTFDAQFPVLHLENGDSVTAKSLLIATGADYRLLGVEGCDQYEGRGIYYAATPMEAQMCAGSEVFVVGGGNSAGQAAVFLAGQVKKVYVIIRGDDLYKSMSSYLAKRIEQTENITLLTNAEIRAMQGDGHLTAVEVFDDSTGQTRRIETPAVFSFIGAVPRTDWLPAEIERDAQCFVLTGPAAANSPKWTAKRPPFLLETTRRGVFAAGDVRSGSVKRVASAVGEGSMTVQFVHEHLKDV